MKRIIALLLAACLLASFVSCSNNRSDNEEDTTTKIVTTELCLGEESESESSTDKSDTTLEHDDTDVTFYEPPNTEYYYDEPEESDTLTETETTAETEAEVWEPVASNDELVDFKYLDEEGLNEYVENAIYQEAIKNIDLDKYCIDSISVCHLSKEYYQELSANTKENIYFGKFKLSELDAQFQGKRYVFDVDENGHTIVREERESDNSYDKIIKNVLTGTGVILVCITVSAVSAVAGAPAMAMVFAASAKSGTAMALSSGAIGGIVAGVVKSFETDDLDEIVKAAELAASEGFKVGSIVGALSGGVKTFVGLYRATSGGLTMNQVATIQKESGYPLDVIKQIKSMDEYKIYKDAGLKPAMIGNKSVLVRDIDLDFEVDGMTNLERMKQGFAPLDPTGKPYQLHHINQNPNGTLAILTGEEHQGNAAILNVVGKVSEIDRNDFAGVRGNLWQNYAALFAA